MVMFAIAQAEMLGFIPLVAPIIMICLILIFFGDILIYMLKLIPQALSLLAKIWNPEVFIKEIMFGVYTGIIMFFANFMDIIQAMVMPIFEKIGLSDNIFGMNAGVNKTTVINAKLCTQKTVSNKIRCFPIRPIFKKEELRKIESLLKKKINQYALIYTDGTDSKKVEKFKYRFKNKDKKWWKRNFGITEPSNENLLKIIKRYKEPKDIKVTNYNIQITMSSENSALIIQQMLNDRDLFTITHENKIYGLSSVPIYSSVVCAKTTYLQYAILIICPPLYIGLRKGIKGWHYIVIDIILTLIFYFPGLIYAIVITSAICPNITNI